MRSTTSTSQAEHPVEVRAGSLAAEMVGAGVRPVNLHHHQGVRELGDGALVTARSVPDDLVEAVESPDHAYVLGVQWHPESEHLHHAFTHVVRAAAAGPAAGREGSR